MRVSFRYMIAGGVAAAAVLGGAASAGGNYGGDGCGGCGSPPPPPPPVCCEPQPQPPVNVINRVNIGGPRITNNIRTGDQHINITGPRINVQGPRITTINNHSNECCGGGGKGNGGGNQNQEQGQGQEQNQNQNQSNTNTNNNTFNPNINIDINVTPGGGGNIDINNGNNNQNTNNNQNNNQNNQNQNQNGGGNGGGEPGNVNVVNSNTASAYAYATAMGASAASGSASAYARSLGTGSGFAQGGGGSFYAPSGIQQQGQINMCVDQEQLVTRTRLVETMVMIRAVCIDDRGAPHPAARLDAADRVARGFSGELYRCVAGSYMQVTFGSASGDFNGGSSLQCAKGEALWHEGATGELSCRPQSSQRDCFERSLLRRHGPGTKILMTVREESYQEVEVMRCVATAGLYLSGGVGGY